MYTTTTSFNIVIDSVHTVYFIYIDTISDIATIQVTYWAVLFTPSVETQSLDTVEVGKITYT
jgi:hypothetical protein